MGRSQLKYSRRGRGRGRGLDSHSDVVAHSIQQQRFSKPIRDDLPTLSSRNSSSKNISYEKHDLNNEESFGEPNFYGTGEHFQSAQETEESDIEHHIIPLNLVELSMNVRKVPLSVRLQINNEFCEGLKELETAEIETALKYAEAIKEFKHDEDRTFDEEIDILLTADV